MSDARISVMELLNALDRTQRFYKSAVLHAPGAENGWAPLADLVELTASQAMRVISRIDDADGRWDADLPAPSPDSFRNLAERIRMRRETKARHDIIREWQRSQRPETPPAGPRVH